jgi:hypothetical protein
MPRPRPRPKGRVTPGARNFSGAPRKEIVSTIPSHVKVTAAAALAASPPAEDRWLSRIWASSW